MKFTILNQVAELNSVYIIFTRTLRLMICKDNW